MQYPDNPRF